MYPSGEQRASRFWKSVRDWAKTIIIALIIALPIRYFIAEPFIVSGASMDPTFASGQFLIVDRLTYRFEPPKRGDIIIFEYPNNPEVYYIKRVIGLPGETLRLENGIVLINEKPLDEKYIAPVHISMDTMAPITLGETEYFVMGDNRAQSSDSRFWGPLESKFIVGRPALRLLPLGKLSVFPGEVRN